MNANHPASLLPLLGEDSTLCPDPIHLPTCHLELIRFSGYGYPMRGKLKQKGASSWPA